MLDELAIYNLMTKYPNTVDLIREVEKMARAEAVDDLVNIGYTKGVTKGIEIGKERIIDDLNEIICFNTMSHFFTKEQLYKSVYKKICEYLDKQLKENKE